MVIVVVGAGFLVILLVVFGFSTFDPVVLVGGFTIILVLIVVSFALFIFLTTELVVFVKKEEVLSLFCLHSVGTENKVCD